MDQSEIQNKPASFRFAESLFWKTISLSSRLMCSRKVRLHRKHQINRRNITDMQMRLWKYFGLTVLFCVTACPHRIAVHQIVTLFFFTVTADFPKKLLRQASDLRIQALKRSSKLFMWKEDLKICYIKMNSINLQNEKTIRNMQALKLFNFYTCLQHAWKIYAKLN